MREQGIALEDHCRVTLVWGKGVDRLITQIDLTFVRRLEARYHAKYGSLSAARRPEQRREASRLNIQAHIMNRVKILFCLRIFIYLGNVFQTYPFLFLCHSVFLLS